MTRSQRNIHVLLWLVLGPIALAGLVLALQGRPPQPVHNGPLPGVDSADAQTDQQGATP